MRERQIRDWKKAQAKAKRGWEWRTRETRQQGPLLYLGVWIDSPKHGYVFRPYAAEVWKTKGTYYAWRVGNAKGAAPTLREAMRTAHAMVKITGGRP